jgi:hypothetical protein
VELLLRRILRVLLARGATRFDRAALWACASSMAACAHQLTPDLSDSDSAVTHDQNEEKTDPDPGLPHPVDAGTLKPTDDAGTARDASVALDAGAMRDAQPIGVDAAYDARPPGADAARDAGRSDAETVPEDAGSLGPAIVCEGNTYYPISAAGLKPTQPYDYLALRSRNNLGGAGVDAGDAWSETNFRVLSETGTPCATAQGPGCAEQVAHHPARFVATSCVEFCVEQSVVTTHASDVQRWVGMDSVKQLLGSIDSVDDALLLVNSAGYDLSCNDAAATSVRQIQDGYEVYATKMTETCTPIRTTRYHLRVSQAGELSVLGSITLRLQENACTGRKPAGLRSQSLARGRDKLGDYLAHSAHLEAASVIAFERLACELNAHSAPLELVDQAITARGDEVRHTEMMAQLARYYRGAPVKASVETLAVRPLEDIALENAVEGCVRETYGALVGGYQAYHARDPALRSAMYQIAEDEARHAALSHRVQRWILPQLDAAARARVAHAQQRAVFELAAEVATPIDDELRLVAGLPSPAMGRMLLDELSRALWNPSGHKPRSHNALG